MTSHFTGTTKTEAGVTESNVWRGASSDDCEKQTVRVQTWRAAADRSKYVRQHIPWTCLPQAHLRVFQLCLWPRLPGRLPFWKPASVFIHYDRIVIMFFAIGEINILLLLLLIAPVVTTIILSSKITSANPGSPGKWPLQRRQSQLNHFHPVNKPGGVWEIVCTTASATPISCMPISAGWNSSSGMENRSTFMRITCKPSTSQYERLCTSPMWLAVLLLIVRAK